MGLPFDGTDSEQSPDDPSRNKGTRPTASDGRQAQPVDLDHVFDVLRNQRRRDVLRYLEASSDPVPIGELAEQLAAWENDKSVAELTSSERKRMYVGLYQSHLPKMDDLAVVDFDKPRGVIAPGDDIDAFVQYLEQPGTSGGWPLEQYAVLLSLLSAAILGGALVLSTTTTFDGLRIVAGIVALLYLSVGATSVLQ